MGRRGKIASESRFSAYPLRERFHTILIPTARERLGEKTFTEGWDKGRAMKMEEAIAYALALAEE